LDHIIYRHQQDQNELGQLTTIFWWNRDEAESSGMVFIATNAKYVCVHPASSKYKFD